MKKLMSVLKMLVLISFCSFCLIAVPKASFGGRNPVQPVRVPLNTLLGNTFPINPMLEGMTEFKIAPGIFSYKIDGTENERATSENGQGIGISLIHAFGSHFGLGVLGAYTQSDGSTAAGATRGFSSIGYTDSSKYSGTIKEKGSIVGGFVILDPFSDPDGLRLPFMLGIAYKNLSVDWDVPFIFTSSGTSTTTQIGDRGQENGSYSLSDFGSFIGFSLQFNTGPFRWSPFFSSSLSFNKPDYTLAFKNLDRGNSTTESWREEDANTNISSIGIPVTYRPWGLTFTYLLPASIMKTDPGKTTMYVISWTKKW